MPNIEKRISWLERRMLPAPPDPHIFVRVIDASVDPDDSDPQGDLTPELPVAGYSAGFAGRPVRVDRLNGETVQQLQRRIEAKHPPGWWMPFQTEAA